MKVLFLGDIVGRLGLSGVSDVLPKIVKTHAIDFVIANGENVSRGRGLTRKDYQEMVDMGIDAITLGNHYHGKEQIDDYIDEAEQLIRPLNLKNYFYGVGSEEFEVNGIPIRVTNLLGTAFMKGEIDSPKDALEALLEDCEPGIHIVDYHAESTSEKKIFGFYFDGRVTAVLGTHTHVQTADERVLPKGTGYISDAGFSGAYDSVIGFNPESAISRTLLDGQHPIALQDEGEVEVDGVILDIDEYTYLTNSITRIRYINGKEA